VRLRAVRRPDGRAERERHDPELDLVDAHPRAPYRATLAHRACANDSRQVQLVKPCSQKCASNDPAST
jgi:hypothetical protein